MSFTPFKKAGVAAAIFLSCAGSALAQNAPLDTLVKTAALWAQLGDANQSDRMWDASGQIMQKSISKPDWSKYLGNLHAELGNVQGRDWVQVARMVNPSGLPPGEYMNVMFNARFAKSPTIEKVSLTQANGKWIPVGYVVNKIEPAPAPAAPAAAKK